MLGFGGRSVVVSVRNAAGGRVVATRSAAMSEFDSGESELSASERDELERLRKENRLLRVEKTMLLRIATEYALDDRTAAPREDQL